jgi:hypothetical protein
MTMVRRGKTGRRASGGAVGATLAALLLAAHAAGARRAEADELLDRPTAPRLVDLTTAQMPFAHAMTGISHRGEPVATMELSLGGIAALGAGYEDRLLAGDDGKDAEVRGRRTVWFRMNAAAGRWFAQQPALDLTFQRTLSDDDDDKEDVQAAEIRATATQSWRSSRFGVLDLSCGVGLWEVARGEERLSQRPFSSRIRPFAGLAWTPPSYPRTSLLIEGTFGPSVIAGQPRLDWRLGWGARYQVFSWSTIDLVVRNRQDAGLAGSTVMVRLAAQLD